MDEYKVRTNPHNKDSDGDTISDGDEVVEYKTNPLQKDTDGGGISDGDEVKKGTDPKNSLTAQIEGRVSFDSGEFPFPPVTIQAIQVPSTKMYKATVLSDKSYSIQNTLPGTYVLEAKVDFPYSLLVTPKETVQLPVVSEEQINQPPTILLIPSPLYKLIQGDLQKVLYIVMGMTILVVFLLLVITALIKKRIKKDINKLEYIEEEVEEERRELEEEKKHQEFLQEESKVTNEDEETNENKKETTLE
jgi:hypothetical protein